MNCSIELTNAQLHYVSDAYRQRSLKATLFNALKGKRGADLANVHALRDVSLRIGAGERVGLLGPNGAGKSTLLKAIAGIYPLSGGERRVAGEIRALLELSLGFESEATGRENIMYRGLMLGRQPREMRAMSAQIIEFADLGDFIDYPLKAYSAGMMVRLAFAISTAVGGEILLLDEVLGAGDLAFMRKAKARIDSLVKGANILVLATHDLGSLRSMCSRLLLFDHGRIVYDGNVEQGIAQYSAANTVGAAGN